MRVIFVSDEQWPLAEAPQAPLASFVTSMIVTSRDIAAISAKILSIQPDVVFLNYPPDVLREIVKDLRAMAGHIAIVASCADPSPETLLELMRLGTSDILTEQSVAACDTILARLRLTPSSKLSRQPAKRIGFVSAKGGDGASFILANLAASLAAQSDGKILLLDLALPFGDLDIYLSETTPTHDLSDFAHESERLDAALMQAMVHHVAENLDIIPTPINFSRVAGIYPGAVANFVDKVADQYAFILFDFGASVDQVGLPLIDTLDSLVLISRMELASTRRAGQLIKFFEDLEFSKAQIRLVTNEFGGKPSIAVSEFESALTHPVARSIPDAGGSVVSALARSTPVVEIAPRSRFSRAIAAWSADILGNAPRGRKLWEVLSLKW